MLCGYPQLRGYFWPSLGYGIAALQMLDGCELRLNKVLVVPTTLDLEVAITNRG